MAETRICQNMLVVVVKCVSPLPSPLIIYAVIAAIMSPVFATNFFPFFFLFFFSFTRDPNFIADESCLEIGILRF